MTPKSKIICPKCGAYRVRAVEGSCFITCIEGCGGLTMIDDDELRSLQLAEFPLAVLKGTDKYMIDGKEGFWQRSQWSVPFLYEPEEGEVVARVGRALRAFVWKVKREEQS